MNINDWLSFNLLCEIGIQMVRALRLIWLSLEHWWCDAPPSPTNRTLPQALNTSIMAGWGCRSLWFRWYVVQYKLISLNGQYIYKYQWGCLIFLSINFTVGVMCLSHFLRWLLNISEAKTDVKPHTWDHGIRHKRMIKNLTMIRFCSTVTRSHE